MISRAAYRARQLRRTLNPRVSDGDLGIARERLPPELFPLFESMYPADQRHCLDVHHKLCEQGCDDRDMLTAALIHDAGKGRLAGAKIAPWQRVAYVALQRLPSTVRSRFTAGDNGLGHLDRHGAMTLDLARSHGATPSVMALLEAMESGATNDPRAAALLRADDAC